MEELARRRQYLERRARRTGRPLEPESKLVEAERAELEGPPCPDGFAHLVRFARELDRMRWYPDGPHPFTPDMIERLARLTGREVTPLEVEALVQFDQAMRMPPEDDPVTATRDKSTTDQRTAGTP